MNQQKPIGKTKLFNLVFAILLLFGSAGLQELFAQPTNYCVPFPKGATYEYCYNEYYKQWSYNYMPTITEVQVVRVVDNSIVYDRTSGGENCFFLSSDIINLKYGNQYKITMTYIMNYCTPTCYTYTGWPMYNRLFIDWNQNGSFLDAGEFQGTLYQSANTNTPYSCTWTITVPCTVASGMTRMRLSSCYAYDNGADACINGYYYDYGTYQYYYDYGESEDYIINFIPDVEATFPAQGDILKANEAYDGTTRSGVTYKKPMARMGQTQSAGAILHYAISGPRPSNTVVYEGLDPATMSPAINMGGYRQYDIQAARGIYSYGNNGAFLSADGGEYKLAVTISGGGCPGAAYSTFTVSWPNDLAANDIVSPKSNGAPRFQKYLRNNTIPVSGLFQNVGLNTVTEFWAYCYIVNAAGDTIQRFSRHYDSNNNPGDVALTSAQKVQIDFGTMKLQNVGFYKVYLYCNLLSAVDMETFNNYLPRSGDADYIMEVAYEIQLQANRMIMPAQGDVVIGNRPVIPIGEFKNVGVYDASDVPARLNVYKLPARTTAYSSLITVQDVPSGKYNIKQAQFDVMNLRETGNYEAELIITSIDDQVRSDDTTRITFSVQGGLAGTYTVGAGGDFPTIDSVMNVLYYRGLAGSVTFLLTDSYYKVTNPRAQDAAWDFSTFIINLGWDNVAQQTNTITWKPSAQNAVTRGSVVIDLVSPNGKGVFFGQSLSPANKYAIYTQYQGVGSIARKYVSSQGSITFDGGSQKSLRFRLVSSSAGGQAFYLGRGSKNITVQNCLIENATPAIAGKIWMPMTSYSPVSGFTFQADTLVVGAAVSAYSAGVVNRSSLFGTEQAQLLHVDTLVNSNNKISNNEISGFGYGVMSIGIGELLMENLGDFARFYNTNNEISKNLIYSAVRSGIYLGYEENTSVLNNRIYAVSNTGGLATGILAGGDGSSQFKGYNNIGLNLQGNEISGVSSNTYAGGIRVEQVRNTFPHPSKGQVFFPNVAEASKVSNNAIWGITGTVAAASRVGIHLLTERMYTPPDQLTGLITPNVPAYHPTDDMIINNTIIIGSNNGVTTTSAVAGLALQNLTNTTVKNNAIALTDVGVDASSPVYSGVFYQGTMPLNGGLTSDRNVFWTPSNTNGGFYRFIETDASGNILDLSTRADYNAIDQWRNWTKQDKNSASGNFLTDLVYLGADPNLKLRIVSNPLPLGSLLNNRGERISWLTSDIDGTLRGAAGQRYDIGASEFDGRMYISDVEALTITNPAAYRAGTGTYSDAEYIMTTSPVDITAQVRNSGNLQQNNVTLTVNVYRELPNGIFSTTPELTSTAVTSIPSSESVVVSFGLADKTAPDFAPKTYGDLRGQGYVIPTQFSSMEANVTPKYRISISINADQNNANNAMQKDVRFYIRKSDMRIMLSAENSMTKLDVNSTLDQVAGRLNADSLKKAMSRIGWTVDITNKRYDYDLFDRLGWEPKAVNYTNYRTMWYADGADEAYTRYQRIDIENFLATGNQMEKKNLIVSSQEVIRQHSVSTNTYYDPYFTGSIFRAVDVLPSNPLGSGGNNNLNTVMGVALHRKLTEQIKSTGFTVGALTDGYPQCGLLRVAATGEGLAQATSYYTNHSSVPADSVAGVATTTLNRNVVLLGVDWRHWTRADYIIRASIDFIEKNGGTIIPVELLDFDASLLNNSVQLNWQTATEYKSDKFEIERAVKSEAGTSSFAKIDEIKAAGTSSVTKNYGPILDNKVQVGNTYVYRLKMVDLDGNFKYSQEREVLVSGDNTMTLSVPVPNPVVNSATMTYSVETAGTVNFDLYDLNGKFVKNLFNGSVNGGINTLTVNTSDVQSGTYNVIMKVNDRTLAVKLQVVK